MRRQFAIDKQTWDKRQIASSDGCTSPSVAPVPGDRGQRIPVGGGARMGVSGNDRSLLEHILESVQIRTHRESERMQMRLKSLTPLLAAGAAAAAIAAAPAALAAPTGAA